MRFGEPLVKFLLAGYRERELVWSRSFDLLVEKRTIKQKLLLNIETESQSGLPREQELLIFLALCKSLLELDEADNWTGVPHPVQYVCQLLQWEETDEALDAIHKAIRKYFNLSYTIIEDLHHRFSAAEGITGRAHRLITSFMFSKSPEGQPEDFYCLEIIFDSKAAEDFQEKNLFQIDWDNVVSISSGRE